MSTAMLHATVQHDCGTQRLEAQVVARKAHKQASISWLPHTHSSWTRSAAGLVARGEGLRSVNGFEVL